MRVQNDIDLGPAIPVAIRWSNILTGEIVRLDVFRGFRVSKSFVMFRNPVDWTLANGHGLVTSDQFKSSMVCYDFAQELESLPIQWKTVTEHYNPQIMEITKEVVTKYRGAM